MSDYARIREEILRHAFGSPLDKVTAARLLADGIMAAENDQQILDIVQAVGDAVEPTEQGVVLMTAYAIVARER